MFSFPSLKTFAISDPTTKIDSILPRSYAFLSMRDTQTLTIASTRQPRPR